MTATFVDKRKKSSDEYCVITCVEPGCDKKIRYKKGDKDVPVYCCKHRTYEGRHSEKKILVKEVSADASAQVKTVILRCPRGTCHHRITVCESDWFVKGREKKFDCPVCGTPMVYHKDGII